NASCLTSFIEFYTCISIISFYRFFEKFLEVPTNKNFQKRLKDTDMIQSMSRVGHCIDNGPIEGFWGIIKSEMYQMYEISDEASLRYAIKDYIRFYCQERPQSRYDCKTPLEVRNVALSSEHPLSYPIAKNNKIEKYKSKWSA
ncbi:IS3 family transposase, partial [Streptococcus sp. VTCC 12886]|uniref:IS3 family transposase n=1 Tax=Streptococcus sp. VTCC 12886 TaxID=3413767 RepID=UPI003D9C758B